jgi:hypothetical protein
MDCCNSAATNRGVLVGAGVDDAVLVAPAVGVPVAASVIVTAAVEVGETPRVPDAVGETEPELLVVGVAPVDDEPLDAVVTLAVSVADGVPASDDHALDPAVRDGVPDGVGVDAADPLADAFADAAPVGLALALAEGTPLPDSVGDADGVSEAV